MTTEMTLTFELRMLAYSALLCLVLWIPYILAEIKVRGVGKAVGYPTGFYDDLPDWAQRTQRAHMNMVENIAPFAAFVLIAHVTNATNDGTAFGAALFFYARVAMAVVHIAGIPWLRTLCFAAAWIGSLVVFWNVVV